MVDPVTISAIASLIGGGMSLFGKKKPAQTTQLPRFNEEQQGWMSQLGQMGMQGLQNPMEGFEPIAQQARNQFTTQTVPSLAERFTAMGQGGQRSSDFAGAVGGSGEDLEANLASMGSQYGLQRTSQLQQLLGMGLTPQTENIYQPSQMGGMQAMGGQLMGSGLQGLFSSLGQMGQPSNNQRQQMQPAQQMQQRQQPFQTPDQAVGGLFREQNPGYTPTRFMPSGMQNTNPNIMNMLYSSLY